MNGVKASSETLHRQRGIGEIDARQRELAGEGGAGETQEAGSVLGAESAGAFVGRLDARFEHARDGLARAGLRPDRGERIGGRVALIGAVEDLPIAQIAASAERDRAGRDAAERKRDGGEVTPGEDARVGDRGRLRRGGRRQARRGFGQALRSAWRPRQGPPAVGRCGAWWTSGIEYSDARTGGGL